MANGKTSLEVVLELLAATPEAQALKDRTIASLKSARLTSIRFYCREDEVDVGGQKQKKQVGCASQRVDFRSDYQTFDNVPDSGVLIYSSNVLTDKEIDEVFEANFGVPKRPGIKKPKVATYNLKASKVKDAFHDHMRSKVMSYPEVVSAKSAVEKRLSVEIRAALSSPEAMAGRQAAVDRFMIEEIKKTLLRFRTASKEVLRTALDEFIVHDIMDA